MLLEDIIAEEDKTGKLNWVFEIIRNEKVITAGYFHNQTGDAVQYMLTQMTLALAGQFGEGSLDTNMHPQRVDNQHIFNLVFQAARNLNEDPNRFEMYCIHTWRNPILFEGIER